MNTLLAGAVGLTFSGDADNSRIFGLTIRDFPGDGILLADVSGVRIGSSNASGSPS